MFNPSLNGQLMENRQDFRICIKRDNSKRTPCYKDRPAARKSALRTSILVLLIELYYDKS